SERFWKMFREISEKLPRNFGKCSERFQKKVPRNFKKKFRCLPLHLLNRSQSYLPTKKRGKATTKFGIY
ncbi:hypothetical protein HMPREF1869_00804, partial [Bacteroidales bacterium KA00251]